MKKLPALLCLIALSQSIFAEDAGTTRGIIDIKKPERPADAKILVGPDGYDLAPDGVGPNRWVFKDGVLTATTLWDSLLTKDAYGDFRMHVEFNVNDKGGEKTEEGNGNSGIYIQQRYEIQIHNSHGIAEADFKPSFCGSIYKQKKPDKLVSKPAGEWQTYDIAFRAARFEGEKKTENARITVYHNGELIHDDYALTKQTGAGKKEGPEPGVIKLQGHHNPVKFRNVWIQPLKLD
jgi:acyl-CoA-binding protein